MAYWGSSGWYIQARRYPSTSRLTSLLLQFHKFSCPSSGNLCELFVIWDKKSQLVFWSGVKHSASNTKFISNRSLRCFGSSQWNSSSKRMFCKGMCARATFWQFVRVESFKWSLQWVWTMASSKGINLNWSSRCFISAWMYYMWSGVRRLSRLWVGILLIPAFSSLLFFLSLQVLLFFLSFGKFVSAVQRGTSPPPFFFSLLFFASLPSSFLLFAFFSEIYEDLWKTSSF